ncbi:MAG: transposase [Luteolibacter sp.]
MAHKGIHDRGYLPHWDFKNSVQGITFRLADSVPAGVVAEWRQELQLQLERTDPEFIRNTSVILHRKIAKYEDAGYGNCLLADSEYAGIVQDALIAGHQVAYKLIEWCIISAMGDIVKRWKAGSAIQINRLLERSGSIWMRDYHDRLIRDEDHFRDARIYIRNNPVKAGLCLKPEEWRFSSAGASWDAEISGENFKLAK